MMRRSRSFLTHRVLWSSITDFLVLYCTFNRRLVRRFFFACVICLFTYVVDHNTQ
jgi:hypothetical protein